MNKSVVILTNVTHSYKTDNGIIEKYCYNDNPSNCNTYGALYQWDELMQYISEVGAQHF